MLTIPFFPPCDQIVFLSCVILHSKSPPIKKLYKAAPPDWASSSPFVFPGYGCPQSFQPSECHRSAEWTGRLSGTVSPFRAEQGTSLETPSRARASLPSGPRCCASTTGQPAPAPSPTGPSPSACWPSSPRTSGPRGNSSCTTCVPARGAGGTLVGESAHPWVSGLLPAGEAGGYGRAGRQRGDSGSSKAGREGTPPPVLRLAQAPEPHLPPGL